MTLQSDMLTIRSYHSYGPVIVWISAITEKMRDNYNIERYNTLKSISNNTCEMYLFLQLSLMLLGHAHTVLLFLSTWAINLFFHRA